jgi:predicted NAD/FAD-binding protein
VRIAVIGSGVAGLGAAWSLSAQHEVVLYERDRRFGGHSDTREAVVDGHPIAVDTGFIVYNEPNYPDLTALLSYLGVATEWSDMSFGVSLGGGRYEYGSGWLSFLGQRSNLANPAHWRLLREIARFNREAPALLARAEDGALSLGRYLDERGFGAPFTDRYLLPMAAAIWSASMRDMLAYPARTFVRFFANHGLLRVAGQLRWRTVSGGSREYVARLVEPLRSRARLGVGATRIERDGSGVRVRDTAGQWDRFDRVIVATHGDQALALLGDASARERQVLGAFRYTANAAVLHRDPSLMPRRRRVWSSWNYVADDGAIDAPASLTYWMNRLQNLGAAPDIFVSLNPTRPPAAELTMAEMRYDHPLFDRAALEAQRALPALQGEGGVFFCGSYAGYGFHEDALVAGLDVAERLGARRPWRRPETGRPPLAEAPHLPDLGDLVPLPAPAPVPVRATRP